MTLGTRAQLSQPRKFRSVRRAGAYAPDLDSTGADLFNVTGVCEVHFMFGVCTTVIGAGLAVPGLTFIPTVGAGAVPLCLAAASIALDAAGTVYTWNGLLNGQLTPFDALGIADTTITWAGGFLTLPAGVIHLVNGTDANSGVIDWYVLYLPQVAVSLITAIPAP